MTDLVPHGLTPHQYGRRRDIAARREKYGPSGMSPAAKDRMRGWMRKAQAARMAKHPKSLTCKQGHRWTAENTRLSWKRTKQYWQRHCRACEAVTRGRAQWDRLKRERLDDLRLAMIAAHPDKGGTAAKFRTARRQYLAAKVAAA